MKKLPLLLLLIIALGISFGAGLLTGKNQVVCRVCQPEQIDFSLFWEAYETLQSRFVDPEKIDTQKIIYGAIEGMVKSLEDPYTIFLSPEETKKFKEDISGRFEGIGIEIGKKDEQLQVIAPLEGTPAKTAGLKAGDKILQIDDTPTIDLSIDEAVNLIRGPKGTKVVLTIFREGLKAPKEVEITRDVIEIPSMSWELKDISENDKIAYIKIYQFSEKAGFDFAVAVREILNSPANKIVLDLRNNPGGYLEISQEIAGWFLEQGNTVVIEDFGGKQDQRVYQSQGNSRLLQYPMTIIINEGTASASEILAGALRDNRGIKIIGEKSYGKGSIQELEELKGGSVLKITVAKWLTPNGELITGKGLEPDIKIEVSPEDLNGESDPQLDKAIEILKEIR
ncbi:MAG: hypothetical protein A3F15_01065 [Candidatus Wildermuthbacteria bacterium RIFCSPHIGHO2_12_FULL_40_12]|uniref:PDZ domain-containing protein n=1 Tax=Candidatus Wildermuthbacteria bacterium RIFCSPHIGHO2_12_FULL_40_12 TaxID=1802457 RepID=A0A1G2RCA4_9BACT|nr:MAG: hypothetical protein A3F15_01065 [Candidatus Wildermuthbacteria bacterium RIFCSPHIGHO2_12_FULL_40_12]